jgi:hypothetical protein
MPSIFDVMAASSARFAASFGAGAATPSFSSSSVRAVAGLSCWPWYCFAASTALLKYSSPRSVAFALRNSVSMLMNVA